MRPVSEQVARNIPRLPPAPRSMTRSEQAPQDGHRPSDRCDDAEFLRRVSLDLCGTLPSPMKWKLFWRTTLQTSVPRKLMNCWKLRPMPLGGPRNSATTPQQRSAVDQRRRPTRHVKPAWYDWLKRRIADNVPYDELLPALCRARVASRGNPIWITARI